MSKSAHLIALVLKRHLVDEKRETKASFCRRADIVRPSLDGYLAETSTPGVDALDRIADALGVTAAEILAPDGDPLRPNVRALANLCASLQDSEVDLLADIARTLIKGRAKPAGSSNRTG